MSISAKGYQYLNFLSDFWRVFYRDASVIETALRVEAELVKDAYFTVLQEQIPRAVQNDRVFQEKFWNLIELVYDPALFEVVVRRGVSYFSYPLDESYAHIPQLYNIIFNPTVRLKEGQDYIIERELGDTAGDGVIPTVNSRILFRVDPFLSNDIPKRITTDNKLSMALWAPKVYIDDMHLYEQYGALLDQVDISSEEYKAFLHGVMYLFTNGPSISALNAGISLAAGYAVARQEEAITKVLLENGVYTLYSDKGSTYEIPRKIVEVFNETTQVVDRIAFPTMRMSRVPYQDELGATVPTVDFSNADLVDGEYPTYLPVNLFDTFITDLRVVDAVTEPGWWRSQVDTLASSLVPDMPNELRSHPGVKDYLFETFFRHNTFGVFIDYRAFREDFHKLPDYMGILHKVKPTYKSFVVYEDDLHVFTLMRFRPDELGSLQGFVNGSPVPSPIVLPDGSIIEPPRQTDIPSPTIDPNTGLPTSGIDPATGQPYPPDVLDDIKNVFDVVGLRNFLDIYDIAQIHPFVGVSLPLDNQPVQIGVGLENVRHSLDYTSFTITISPESSITVRPGLEPIMGMQAGIGMAGREGILERHTFTLGFSPDDEIFDMGEDLPPSLVLVELP